MGADCVSARDASPGEMEPVRLALILQAGLPAGFVSAVLDGAAQAALEQSVDLIVRSGEKSMSDALGVVAAAHAESPLAGIVMAANSPDKLVAALVRVGEIGVPAITIGAGMDVARAAGAALHVGPDDFAAGRAAGLRLRNNGAVEATCVKSPADTIAQDVRCMGLGAGLARSVAILVLPDPGDDLANVAGQLLENRKAGDALLFAGANPLAARTASDAGAGNSGPPIPVAAIEPDRAFLNGLGRGRGVFAVDTQPHLQGYLPIVILAHAARTGDLPTSDIATGPKFLTPDTVDTRPMPMPAARPSRASGGDSGISDEVNFIENATTD